MEMVRQRSFRDRLDAGAQLAASLAEHAGRDDVVVLGLPRGGVPVAGVIATRLGAPLDAMVVRKVGVPGHEELAVGAVGPGGITILDRALMAHLGLTPAALGHVVDRERDERDRRELAYREGRAPPALAGRTVLLVDDGLATGATMAAAVAAVRPSAPRRVVVAVPVASPGGARRLLTVADAFVAVVTPADFSAVGQWYRDFTPVADDEVLRWLRGSGR